MYSNEDLLCSETEIANLLGVSKELVKSFFCELQNAGYKSFLGCSNTVNPMKKWRNAAQPIRKIVKGLGCCPIVFCRFPREAEIGKKRIKAS